MRNVALTEKQSRAFSAGNYASAYGAEDFSTALANDELDAERFPIYPEGSPEREAYMAGFYSSFEIGEVPLEHRETVACWRLNHEDY